MLRRVVIFLMVIAGYILQTTFFKTIALAGVVPNILMIITASFGFMCGKNEGMYIGFFAGLLIDIFFGGGFIGFYALVYMVIGYLNGIFNYIFYPEDIKLPMILIGTSELFYCFICYVFRFLLRGKLHFNYYFIHIIIPDIVYTILVTLVLYKGILFVNDRLESREIRRN